MTWYRHVTHFLVAANAKTVSHVLTGTYGWRLNPFLIAHDFSDACLKVIILHCDPAQQIKSLWRQRVSSIVGCATFLPRCNSLSFLAWGALAGPWTEASVLQYLFTAKPSRRGNILLRTLISGLEFLPWAQVQHHVSAYHCSQTQTFYSHAQETGTASRTESMWWTGHNFHRHLSTKVGGASPRVHRVPLLNASDEEITSETKLSIQHTLLG